MAEAAVAEVKEVNEGNSPEEEEAEELVANAEVAEAVAEAAAEDPTFTSVLLRPRDSLSRWHPSRKTTEKRGGSRRRSKTSESPCSLAGATR